VAVDAVAGAEVGERGLGRDGHSGFPRARAHPLAVVAWHLESLDQIAQVRDELVFFHRALTQRLVKFFDMVMRDEAGQSLHTRPDPLRLPVARKSVEQRSSTNPWAFQGSSPTPESAPEGLARP